MFSDKTSLFTFLGCVLVDNFLGQSQMVFRTCRVGIVENHGQSVAWTLAELHVALNDGLEHKLLEVSFHLVVYLIGQSESAVVHCQQEALNLERRVELALDNLDGIEQLGDAFECKVLALHGYDDRVGRSPSEGLQSMSI